MADVDQNRQAVSRDIGAAAAYAWSMPVGLSASLLRAR
jgi:hypothetical protein